jgi:hypothetical protein
MVGEGRETGDAQRFEGSLATDAAAGGRVEVPLEAVEIQLDARGHFNAQDVLQSRYCIGLPHVRGPRDLAGGVDDALGEQEADGEFRVMSGRAHRDGHGPCGGP